MTNFGQEFEPPDQGLCVGNGFVARDGQLGLHGLRPNGQWSAGPFNVNGPFDEGLTEFTSDPRCYYDAADPTPGSRRSCSSAGDSEKRRTSTSRSTRPATHARLWTAYKIDTTDPHGPGIGCPCFGDQPRLGIDPHNLYVSDRRVLDPRARSSTAGRSTRSRRRTWSRSSRAAHFAHFPNLRSRGDLAVRVQPALTTGAPSAEYFLSSLDPNGTFDKRIGVWALTKRQSGRHRRQADAVEPRPAPRRPTASRRGAQQKGATSLLDTATTACSRPSSSTAASGASSARALTIPRRRQPQRAGAAWFQVEPAADRRQARSARPRSAAGLRGRQRAATSLSRAAGHAGGRRRRWSGRCPAATFPERRVLTTLTPGGRVWPGRRSPRPDRPTTTRSRTLGRLLVGRARPKRESIWLATGVCPAEVEPDTGRRRNWGTRVMNVSAP